jgi:glycosyltransferase involved in cell wall biosynthesis
MRIAFLCTSSLNDPSPRGRYLPIAAELVRAGHEVTLLMLHPMLDTVRQRRALVAGVAIEYVAQMHVYGMPGRRRYYGPAALLLVALRAALSLAAAAIRLRPDALHIAKAQPINGLAGLLARPAAGEIYLDLDDYEAAANRFGATWQRALVELWEDRLPHAVRAVSVNTTFLRERCLTLGVPQSRIFYIPNGIAPAVAAARHAVATAGLRDTLGLHGGPTIVYLGTISTIAHSVDLLLEAFALLRARLPAAQLLMVGDGDELPDLRARAVALDLGASVRWVGRVPPQAAPAYLALGDCSVDPVHDTPGARARSPLKIVESLALGVPVVTGDVGDRAEVIGSGGVIVAPGDARALANGIALALAAPQSMRDAARAQAEAYRWDRLAEQWMAMYRR